MDNSPSNSKQNPRVLFIHGFMGSALNWGSTRNFLEAQMKAQTYAIDLLGHALNHAKQPTPDAHQALVEDLEAQITSFSPTHVVAHSFGFRPALLLGIKNPKLIPHLFVEDSSPDLTKDAFDFLMGILNTKTPFNNRDEARAYFDQNFGIRTAVSRFLLSNIRSTPDGRADWRFDKAFLKQLLQEALKNDLWKEWKEYSGSAELIYGSRSDGISQATIDRMKTLRPKLPVHRIEDSGHWIHADQPHAFVDLLCSLMRS